MKSKTFSLGAWMPDIPVTLSAYTPDGELSTLPMQSAENCRPGFTSGTYIPFNGWVAVSTNGGSGGPSDLTPPSRVFTATGDDGVRYQFIGDTAALWLMDNGTGALTNVKSATYTGTSLNYWSFCQYGNRVIATNGVDPVQTYLLGVDSVFSNLAGNPPRAKTVFTFGNFVILGNLINDVDLGTNPSAYRNCAIDNPTDWTTSTTTQCDVAILNGDGGEIVGGVELSSGGMIFQQRNIWRLTYIGSPIIFDVKRLSSNIGAGPRSIVVDQDIVYFWDTTGIYRSNGGSVDSISAGKIDKYLRDTLDGGDVTPNSSAVDPQLRYLYWGYESSVADVNGITKRILSYNITTQEFAIASMNHHVLGVGLNLAYNLDTIDALVSSGGIDGFSGISFDNPILNSSLPTVGAMAYDSGTPLIQWGTFKGTILQARFSTKTLRFHPTKRAQLTKCRPFIETTLNEIENTNARVYKRDLPFGDYTAASLSYIGDRGWINLRGSGLEMYIRIAISDDFTNLTGLELQYNILGSR